MVVTERNLAIRARYISGQCICLIDNRKVVSEKSAIFFTDPPTIMANSKAHIIQKAMITVNRTIRVIFKIIDN